MHTHAICGNWFCSTAAKCWSIIDITFKVAMVFCKKIVVMKSGHYSHIKLVFGNQNTSKDSFERDLDVFMPVKKNLPVKTNS